MSCLITRRIRDCLSLLGALLLVACLLSGNALATSQPPALVELDWKDLVPGGWRPPIILPNPSAHEAHIVDTASLVSELQNKHVKIPGYMVPIVFEENLVSSFLLVPFLEHQAKKLGEVCRHIHHEPNQMVYVSLAEAVIIVNPFQPVWVTGEMLLETAETDAGLSGYKINNAATAEYVY